MRLIDTRTGEFRMVNDPRRARYAILSHTWAKEGEQTYQDVLAIQQEHLARRRSHDRSSPTNATDELDFVMPDRDVIAAVETVRSCDGLDASGQCAPTKEWVERLYDTLTERRSILTDTRISEKIRMTCALALLDGYTLAWIDSCCIDKTSSAELSESINSMYDWYQHAAMCYVYLADVDDSDDPYRPESQFRKSRWHSRGWTLQEMIAPRYLIFLSRGWRVMGTKMSFSVLLEEVTHVDAPVLIHQRPVEAISVCVRMSWASKRATTRVEDQAYSLMGLFGVHMPTIYGEGRNAFIRLQEEILKRTYDQTIFIWGPWWRSEAGVHPQWQPKQAGRRLLPDEPFAHMYGLLATSPQDFQESGHAYPIRHDVFAKRLELASALPRRPEYVISYDVRITLPVIPRKAVLPLLPESEHDLQFDFLALLAAQECGGKWVAIALQDLHDDGSWDAPMRVGATSRNSSDVFSRMFSLTDQEIDSCLGQISVDDLHIYRRPRDFHLDGMGLTDVAPHHDRYFTFDDITPEPWCPATLGRYGFALYSSDFPSIPAKRFRLVRAGDDALELVDIYVRLRRAPEDEHRFTEVERDLFEITYKLARAEVAAQQGDFPPLGDGVYIDMCQVQPPWSATGISTRTAVYLLQHTPELVRDLRVSVKFGDYGREIPKLRVAVEISQLYVPSTVIRAAPAMIGVSDTDSDDEEDEHDGPEPRSVTTDDSEAESVLGRVVVKQWLEVTRGPFGPEGLPHDVYARSWLFMTLFNEGSKLLGPHGPDYDNSDGETVHPLSLY